MKNTAFVLLTVLVFFLSGCTKQSDSPKTPETKRESILDRVEFIEPELITEVPKFLRLCDSIQLIKKRIDVGDAELYVEEEGNGIPTA